MDAAPDFGALERCRNHPARARDGDHAAHLYGLGVREAVPETLEASLQVSEALLAEAGVPMGKILVAIHNKRADMRAALLEASSAGTPSQRLRSLRDSQNSRDSMVKKTVVPSGPVD